MQESNFLLYTTPSGDVRLDVMLFEESIWLTQKAMAELFSVGVPAISKHLANIFESGELVEDAVISILETTASDGKNYKTRSEEHTSELQSRENLVCRLLLE